MLNYELGLGMYVLFVIWIDSIYDINMLHGRTESTDRLRHTILLKYFVLEFINPTNSEYFVESLITKD